MTGDNNTTPPIWGETFGDAEYTWTFETFIAGSVEKTLTAMVLGQIIDALYTSSDCQESQRAPLVLDIGCHDGATLEKILRHTSSITGLHLYGLDYKPGALSAFENRFCSDSGAWRPRILDVRSVASNAFSGDIGAHTGLKRKSVDYALVSHVLYGVDRQEMRQLLADIATNLLSDRGIAFFVHVGEAGSTTAELRNRYGDRAERNISASTRKVRCTPTEIGALASMEGYGLRSIAYPVKTYFEKMSDADWDMVQSTTDFDAFLNEPVVARNIARISFIALRTPLALVREGSSWVELTQKVRERVQATESRDHAGYLEDNVVLQLLFNARAGARRDLSRDVEGALERLAVEMPDLQASAESALLTRFG